MRTPTLLIIGAAVAGIAGAAVVSSGSTPVVIESAAAGSDTSASAGWTDAEARERLRALSNDDVPGDTYERAGYMNETLFNKHFGDHIDQLCDWVDSHVQPEDDHVQAVYDRLHAADGDAGGDGLPVVLANICGYEDPVAVREYNQRRWEEQAERSGSNKPFPKPVWYADPPYPWGPQRQAPGGPREHTVGAPRD